MDRRGGSENKMRKVGPKEAAMREQREDQARERERADRAANKGKQKKKGRRR